MRQGHLGHRHARSHVLLDDRRLKFDAVPPAAPPHQINAVSVPVPAYSKLTQGSYKGKVRSRCLRQPLTYMPDRAALDALALAGEMFPNLRPQALIDRLLITAVSSIADDLAYKPWEPPHLQGRHRDAWKLPDELRLGTRS